jgi:hypothetical protein
LAAMVGGAAEVPTTLRRFVSARLLVARAKAGRFQGGCRRPEILRFAADRYWWRYVFMNCGLLCTPLAGLFLALAFTVAAPAGPLAEEQESGVKQSNSPRASTRKPKPLVLKLEVPAQRYREDLESARLDLELGLREVLRQRNRRGLDLLELIVGPSDDSKDSWRLALVARNFIPESTGPWDKQDVLFFSSSRDSPVYLNLSLLQSMIQPIAAYRTHVLSRISQSQPAIEVWSVTFEKNTGQSLCFEGGFEDGRPITHPTILIRGGKMEAPLAIKADGENVMQALSRGTFPLPPLRIFGNQFSSTKSILEFFDREKE